jgi:hypothetical protein
MRDDMQCDTCGCKHQRFEGCPTSAVKTRLNNMRERAEKAEAKELEGRCDEITK